MKNEVTRLAISYESKNKMRYYRLEMLLKLYEKLIF